MVGPYLDAQVEVDEALLHVVEVVVVRLVRRRRLLGVELRQGDARWPLEPLLVQVVTGELADRVSELQPRQLVLFEFVPRAFVNQHCLAEVILARIQRKSVRDVRDDLHAVIIQQLDATFVKRLIALVHILHRLHLLPRLVVLVRVEPEVLRQTAQVVRAHRTHATIALDSVE